jgi:hypothetical protein
MKPFQLLHDLKLTIIQRTTMLEEPEVPDNLTTLTTLIP